MRMRKWHYVAFEFSNIHFQLIIVDKPHLLSMWWGTELLKSLRIYCVISTLHLCLQLLDLLEALHKQILFKIPLFSELDWIEELFMALENAVLLFIVVIRKCRRGIVFASICVFFNPCGYISH